MLAQLLDSSLFKDIDINDLENIAHFTSQQEFGDGEVIINENDTQGCDIFILLSGQVEILSTSGQLANNEVVISSHEKDILGEISWILRNKRTATVRSIGESLLLQIDGVQLMDFFETNHHAGYLFMKGVSSLLAKRLVKTDNLLKQVLWNYE